MYDGISNFLTEFPASATARLSTPPNIAIEFVDKLFITF